ncbi:membrane protein insertion efficiency factor YidD [Pedobacter sp. L105]|uniref:membrane protein insertion efficiency factor YidD n=1 Tax=Pedobacter sp. L105 TaxID=1641871 RepID=UPI00131E7991
MKILLLLFIRIYWATVPKGKRRKCIFRTSCSQYVYQATRKEGFNSGLAALKYRYLNCRGDFHIFEDPIKRSKIMILPNGQGVTEDQIAERLITRQLFDNSTELNHCL